MPPEIALSDHETVAQLQMVWPEHLLNAPPPVQLPSGYSLRSSRRGDEPQFYKLMDVAGWPGWDEEALQPWLPRILPEGWFMAIDEQSREIVASCMALRSEVYPFGGELGWLVGDADHAGKGLGMAVSAAVTARFIDEEYRDIHLYTEDYRLAALKIYLKLGYVPLLYAPEMPERWGKSVTSCTGPLRLRSGDQWSHRPHNLSLERTGDPVKLDQRCRAVCYLSCMMEMLGLLLTTRAPAPQLEAVRLTLRREQNHVMVTSF